MQTRGWWSNMTAYCSVADVNSLFGDISDDISMDMFTVSIDNAGSWIDSALLRNHIPLPEVPEPEPEPESEQEPEPEPDTTDDTSDTDDDASNINDDTITDNDSDDTNSADTMEEMESTITIETGLIIGDVPSILKTASIYFAASDILMSLYHGDQYESLMDYWFNKATSLLDGYIEAYKAENNIDSNVGHRNALTYNERRVNRGYGNRCYY